VNLTPELIAAIVAGIIAIIGALATLINHNQNITATKLQEIHVLVNSRLTEALDQNKSLKGDIAVLHGQILGLAGQAPADNTATITPLA